jgi:alanyl-tRNA synthetase
MVSKHSDTAYRVIADHVRTLSFAIADGAVPSNDGRGYVLRRILRRAVRYGIQTLGAKPGFFAELVPVLVQHMEGTYPELRTRMADIIEIVNEEEKAFSTLLGRGVKYFNQLVVSLRAEEKVTQARPQISGEQAFFMYDTLGFPLDLIQIMAAENDLVVDISRFHAEMQHQKERSRSALRDKRLHGHDQLKLAAEQTAHLQSLNLPPTPDHHKYARNAVLHTEIVAIFEANNGFVPSVVLKSGDTQHVGILLKETSFYAEAGGQAPDSGTLTLHTASDEIVVLDVVDVQVRFRLRQCIFFYFRK